jgi:hypothetical protein
VYRGDVERLLANWLPGRPPCWHTSKHGQPVNAQGSPLGIEFTLVQKNLLKILGAERRQAVIGRIANHVRNERRRGIQIGDRNSDAPARLIHFLCAIRFPDLFGRVAARQVRQITAIRERRALKRCARITPVTATGRRYR